MSSARANVLKAQSTAGRKLSRCQVLGAIPLSALMVTLSLGQAQVPKTARASLNSEGAESNGFSNRISFSPEGRFVVFLSNATNLVENDTNGFGDIFVHDRLTGETTRESVDSSGREANAGSLTSSLSTGGRYVAFSSDASNLVPDDTNEVSDIFVRDRQGGITTRVSIASSGQEGNGRSSRGLISQDGRYVVFSSEATNLAEGDGNGSTDVFVHDRLTGATDRISVGSEGNESNGWSLGTYISADGMTVCFTSDASNLVPDDNNNVRDAFLRDRRTGETIRVSVSSDGVEGNDYSGNPDVSNDGRFVVFESDASNLVPGDANGVRDIFIHDRLALTTRRLSVSSGGVEGDANSRNPDPSGDGRFVAFYSDATNLVADDTNGVTDAFVHDRLTGETIRASLSWDAQEGNGATTATHIAADGSAVAFQSSASNLVPDDLNEQGDVFIRRLPVHELYFAQFGDGADQLFSQIMLVNRSDAKNAETMLFFRDDQGLPLEVDLEGTTWAGEGGMFLPPGGSGFLKTDGAGPLSVGSVAVKSFEPVDGVILFGGSVGLAGVGSGRALENGFLAPVESRIESGQFVVDTGIAVMNLRHAPAHLTLRLRQEDGQEVGAAQESIEGKGHLAQFIHEFDWTPAANLGDFRGTVEVRVEGAIAATVLQTRPGQFATMPIIPLLE